MSKLYLWNVFIETTIQIIWQQFKFLHVYIDYYLLHVHILKMILCWCIRINIILLQLITVCISLLIVKTIYIVCSQGEFTDEGTETHFALGQTLHSAYIQAISSGKRRDGIVHKLFIDEQEIPPAKEWFLLSLIYPDFLFRFKFFIQ